MQRCSRRHRPASSARSSAAQRRSDRSRARPRRAGRSARTTSRVPSGSRSSRSADQVPQPAPDPVADHRRPDRPRDDEAHPRGDRRHSPVGVAGRRVQHDQPGRPAPRRAARRVVGEVGATTQPGAGRKHARSGREPGATLVAAGSEDRAAGPGAHAQAEAVGLGPTAVVGLERALAHSWAPGLVGRSWTAPQSGARVGGGSLHGDRAATPLGAGTPQRPSATRPGNGTGGGTPAVKRSRRSRTHRSSRALSQVTPAARRADTPVAERPRRPSGRNKSRGLWTTACWRARAVVSVSRVAGPFPTRRIRGADRHGARACGARAGHSGATDVHRLWTTVWTDVPAADLRVARTDHGALCAPRRDQRVTDETGARRPSWTARRDR